MGRPPAQRKLSAKALQAKESKEAEATDQHIKWDKAMDERLAVRLANKWKSWEGGNKMSLCREWSKDLGIVLDPKGTRTKNHVMTLLTQYKVAKELENATGSGDIVEKRKTESGDWITVTVTLYEQQLKLCKVFKILDAVLGEKHGNARKTGLGIDEGGVQESQVDLEEDEEDDDVDEEPVQKSAKTRAVKATLEGVTKELKRGSHISDGGVANISKAAKKLMTTLESGKEVDGPGYMDLLDMEQTPFESSLSQLNNSLATEASTTKGALKARTQGSSRNSSKVSTQTSANTKTTTTTPSAGDWSEDEDQDEDYTADNSQPATPAYNRQTKAQVLPALGNLTMSASARTASSTPITRARGRLDLVSGTPKRSRLNIDDDLSIEDPGTASAKRPRAQKKEKLDLLGLWEEDTKSQSLKFEAAKLKYQAMSNPHILRQQEKERDKDRYLELQRHEVERNKVRIRQYEIAQQLGKTIDEVFPGAWNSTGGTMSLSPMSMSPMSSISPSESPIPQSERNTQVSEALRGVLGGRGSSRQNQNQLMTGTPRTPATKSMTAARGTPKMASAKPLNMTALNRGLQRSQQKRPQHQPSYNYDDYPSQTENAREATPDLGSTTAAEEEDYTLDDDDNDNDDDDLNLQVQQQGRRFVY